MRRLILPAKFRWNGLHIWCIDCKKVVTKAPCKHAENQRFQSRIHNPVTQKVDCIQSYETRDVDEAMTLHRKYKADLQASNFKVAAPVQKMEEEKADIIFIKDAVIKYLDYLQDIGVPEQEKRRLSKGYVKDCTRNVTRFLDCVKEVEGKLSSVPVTAVGKKHVTAFYNFLKENEYGQSSYNLHMKAVMAFFDYVIDELEVSMKHPLDKVKLSEVHHDPELIPVEELELLLSMITQENGIGARGDKARQTVNHYRPWLKKVIILSLLTGERLDGVVLLKWSHIEGNFFKIPNFKVNRIQKVDSYYSYTPITTDLAELLLSFDTSDQEGYIVVPEHTNRETLKRFISRAFTHYWTLTGLKRKVTFKNLRKTYETRLTAAIGNKAMFVKHTDDKTAIKHYLDKMELLKSTKDVRLYDTSGWLK
jgi:integrase